MKNIVPIVTALLLSIPTLCAAADAVSWTKAAAPACGATVQECQTKVDDLTRQLAQTTLTIQGARQQRDQAQQALSDALLSAFVAQGEKK